MRITLGWLAEFLVLDPLVPVAEASRVGPRHPGVVRLLAAMNELGMVVEEATLVPASLDGVVIAEVVSIAPIKGADRIRATMVDDGSGALTSVVCGAWNFAEGDRVPWARPGTRLPTGLELTTRRLKGVESHGMLCSPVEVGVSQEAGGLLVLEPDAPVGAEFGAHYGLEDELVIELAIEPNRPDANSVVGVARDLAAYLDLEFRPPRLAEPRVVVAPGAVDTSVCDRLAVAELAIGGARFPLRLARRLHLVGMRSIHPVVDASNYAMIELGQPTHPYDLDKLGEATLGVRLATQGEQLVTLDGATRTLEPGDVVIVDALDRAIGLAGVMGGESTEVSATTTQVLLEVAHFAPEPIARTSKRLRLRSEASMRFERGTDTGLVTIVASRIAELIGVDPPAEVRLLADAAEVPAPILARGARVAGMIGHEPASEVLEVLAPHGALERIGFAIERVGEDYLVTPPSFRPDVRTEIEVIEEVARHFGYQRIRSVPLVLGERGGLTERQRLVRRLRLLVADLGCFEVWSLTMVAPEDQRRAGLAGPWLSLADPMSPQESCLRLALLPSLVRSLETNLARRQGEVRLFEIGPAFLPRGEQELPAEPLRLGVLVTDPANGLRAIAPVLVALVRALGLEESLRLLPRSGTDDGWPRLHPVRQSTLLLDGAQVGVAGELHPEHLRRELWHLAVGRYGYLEVDLEPLLAKARPLERIRAGSPYPSSDLDLSFELPESLGAGVLIEAVREAAGELLADLAVFDRYRPEGEAIRALGLRLRLESAEGPITENLVQGVIERARAAGERLGARLRGGS